MKRKLSYLTMAGVWVACAIMLSAPAGGPYPAKSSVLPLGGPCPAKSSVLPLGGPCPAKSSVLPLGGPYPAKSSVLGKVDAARAKYEADQIGNSLPLPTQAEITGTDLSLTEGFTPESCGKKKSKSH